MRYAAVALLLTSLCGCARRPVTFTQAAPAATQAQVAAPRSEAGRWTMFARPHPDPEFKRDLFLVDTVTGYTWFYDPWKNRWWGMPRHGPDFELPGNPGFKPDAPKSAAPVEPASN